MAVQYTSHVISVCITWQWYCTVIGWSSGDVIPTIQTICNYIINFITIKNAKKKIIIGANLRSSGSWVLWNIVVFRMVTYLLNMFNTKTFLQNCIYMNFRINLTQFYINFSRQEHQIDVLYVPFNAWDSQVSSYTPFIFPLQSL